MPIRKRTNITAQTGTWSLGKTIGAGSMGKVKLAKNQETGETVSVVWILLSVHELISFYIVRH